MSRGRFRKEICIIDGRNDFGHEYREIIGMMSRIFYLLGGKNRICVKITIDTLITLILKRI